jgi:5-keto-L-gluconate epimerase
MKLGISISPLPTRFGPTLHDPDLDGLCRGLAEAGYDGVEVSLVTPEAFTPALASAIQRHGLAVLAIATGQSYVRDRLCLYTRDAAVREAVLARLTGFLPLASELSCPIIVGGVRGNEIPEPAEVARVQELGDEVFRALARAAAKEDVQLLLEPINRYETKYYNRVEEAARFVVAEGLSNVKVLADTFHMNIEEESVTGTVRSHLAQIGYVHVADSNRRYPGAGHVDFSGLLKGLQAEGYQGVVGVEVLPYPTPLEAARRSIGTLKGILKVA